ncbi:MAG: hypothetical protein EYC70_05435 [Planctomycetota bacterium]|nr:MAG: hypothetical protein EYC70_05435 [Planctomycetota bacterium]
MELIATLILAALQEPERKPAPQQPRQEPAADAAQAPAAPRGRALVFRVDRVETLEGDALHNATLVVRDGIIEKLGEAVVLPDKAQIHDLRGGSSTAMPPWVLAHGNFLARDPRSSGRNGRFRAVDSLYLGEEDLPSLLAQGILLVGVDPPGSGIPGRSSVIETTAEAPRPRALVNDLHLKLTIATDPAAVELLRKALKDADEAIEKEKKARQDWEKARKDWEEKQKAKQEAEKKQQEQQKQEKEGEPPKAAQDGDKGQQQKEEKAPPETFEPPPLDPDLKPVVEWVRKQRVAQIWVDDSGDWLHWLDVLGERELAYEVILSHSDQQNLQEVAPALGEKKLRVEAPARLSFLPFTRLRVNLPAELAAAGVRLVLSPPAPPPAGRPPGEAAADMARGWRLGLADLVREGLDRSAALRAVTMEPAAGMGQEERVAPLKMGGPATFIVLDGDPLDPTARVLYVVDRGEVRYDRAKALAKMEGAVR